MSILVLVKAISNTMWFRRQRSIGYKIDYFLISSEFLRGQSQSRHVTAGSCAFVPVRAFLRRFCVGVVAMFFPTPENNFLAFNVGCPGHFLSKESQALIGRDEHFRPYYVLGRIIEIQVMMMMMIGMPLKFIERFIPGEVWQKTVLLLWL